MPEAPTPKVSLTYSPDTGEFTLTVTNTTKVSYTLEYDWDNGGDQSGTDALTNTKNADSKKVFTDTQLAGTKSTEDSIIHNVETGVITLSANVADDKVFSYEGKFKVTQGKIKMLSEQSSTKAASELAVLGDSTASGQLATPSAALEPKITRTSAPATRTETSVETSAPTAKQVPLMPVAIGGGVALVIIVVLIAALLRKKNLPTKQPSYAKIVTHPQLPT